MQPTLMSAAWSAATITPGFGRLVISVITITGIGDHLQPEWLITFERCKQVCLRLLETATEEVSFANSVQVSCHATPRAEAQIVLEMLEREIGFTGKNSE